MTPASLPEDVYGQRARWLPGSRQDHAGVRWADPDSFGERLGGGCIGHAALSHIVTDDASLDYHNLCVAPRAALSHIVIMEKGDQNGGPVKLKAWRLHRDMSQAELAEVVGTNPNMIGYLESGKGAGDSRGCAIKSQSVK